MAAAPRGAPNPIVQAVARAHAPKWPPLQPRRRTACGSPLQSEIRHRALSDMSDLAGLVASFVAGGGGASEEKLIKGPAPLPRPAP